MNKYLKNLNKIEFVITYACTGRCKHCSEGDHSATGTCIDGVLAGEILRKVAGEYDIKTALVFGGEPLLYIDTTCAIIRAAKEMNIERRQVITNGFFSRDEEKIREVANRLYVAGVNDLLLSVDAFHQETIPLDVVKAFAREAAACGIPIRLQPAWLVSPAADNPYNIKTREILAEFDELHIPTSDGNIVFPEGNALKYLVEYFKDELPENPYIEHPDDVRCLSIEPNGDVLGANAQSEDIMDIIERYTP